jgi:hypothetical protein
MIITPIFLQLAIAIGYACTVLLTAAMIKKWIRPDLKITNFVKPGPGQTPDYPGDDDASQP